MVMEYLWFMFTRVTGIFNMTGNGNLQDSSYVYHTNFVNFRFRNLVISNKISGGAYEIWQQLVTLVCVNKVSGPVE